MKNRTINLKTIPQFVFTYLKCNNLVNAETINGQWKIIFSDLCNSTWRESCAFTVCAILPFGYQVLFFLLSCSFVTLAGKSSSASTSKRKISLIVFIFFFAFFFFLFWSLSSSPSLFAQLFFIFLLFVSLAFAVCYTCIDCTKTLKPFKCSLHRQWKAKKHF